MIINKKKIIRVERVKVWWFPAENSSIRFGFWLFAIVKWAAEKAGTVQRGYALNDGISGREANKKNGPLTQTGVIKRPANIWKCSNSQ